MTKAPDAVIDPNVQLDICHVTMAPPIAPMAKMAALRDEIVRFRELCARQAGLSFVNSAEDLYRFTAELRLVGGLQYPPEDLEESDLLWLKEQGVRFLTLGYENDFVRGKQNPYGGGFANREVGLTDKGKALLQMMADAKIALDFSHASEKTITEALDYIEHECNHIRVCASHVGCAAIYGHGRNLSDEILRRIGDLGGIVGVATCTFLLDREDNSLAPFMRHLGHAIEVIGQDSVALGTDGVYKQLDLVEQESLFGIMKGKLDPEENLQARFPDQPVVLNSSARMQFIANELAEYGFAQGVIEKVTGENLRTFFAEALFT